MSVSEHDGTTESGGGRPLTKPAKPDPGFSQSIARGLAILSSFRPNRPLMGVSELAREVQLGRSTAHRYVATLCALGYLEQDPPSRKYRLGPKVIDLGFSAINSMELRATSEPYLQRLSDETGYTANMAILDDTDIIYIERCRSSKKDQARSSSTSTSARGYPLTAPRWARCYSPTSLMRTAMTASTEAHSSATGRTR